MGAMCVQKQPKEFKLPKKQPNFDPFPRKINKQFNFDPFTSKPKENQMVILLKEYRKHYGKQVSVQTEQFINKNYGQNYYSTLTLLNGQKRWTYKYEMIDRLKQAFEGGYRSYNLKIIKVDDHYKYVQYEWEVEVPNRPGVGYKSVYYTGKTHFWQDYKFQKTQIKQYDPLYSYHQSQYLKAAMSKVQDEDSIKKANADKAFKEEMQKRNKDAQNYYLYQKRQRQLDRLFHS